MAFLHLKRAMETPADRTELMATTGLHYDTISNAVDVLVALNLAHVALWMDKHNGGAPLMHVEWGPGDNAPRPKNGRRNRRALESWRRANARPFQQLMRATAPAVQQGQAS